MNKKYSTKRALIASILSLCLCFTMLIGTTFAWFTDSVTSSGNVIQTGQLKVAMYWAEGDENPEAVTDWTNAKDGKIFNNDKWEPGYVEAKHIKIANEGTLALKYQMRILANGVVSELADVIDVYYFFETENDKDLTGAVQLDRAEFTDANKLGTLSHVLKNNLSLTDINPNAISNKVKGSLEAGTFTTLTLAFKMQESAGNEYQNLSIGTDFSIQILATQYTSENDSFDNNYDAGADFAPQENPSAMVYALSQQTAESIVLVDLNKNVIGEGLDVAYSFQPSETYEQALASEHSWSHADFFVYADATVPANSMMLAGYYSVFGDFIGISDTEWIGLSNDGLEVAAGEANGIRLIRDGMGGIISVAYNEICNYGNDGTGFLCGASDLTGQNEGTTLTVELRLYETACDDEGCNHKGYGCETGDYITVGTFTYTFDDPNVEYLPDGSRVRYGEGGEVTLEGVDKVNVTDETYYVPYGVTKLNAHLFTQNSNIKTVVIPDTVTDFGATGVSETGASGGAFRESDVETVVLPEGMTEIPAAAFNQAKKLKQVNIPSSVKTIGVNSFRHTALETLTVPATVETIGYAAFRDMESLTTVTIEGDVHIPGYAFRSCSALKTVYINGENVTVDLGQVFTLTDHNNAGPDMTFYVQNEAVADSIRANMTKNGNKVENVDYEIIVPTSQSVGIQGGGQTINVVISKQSKASIVYHKDLNQNAVVSTIGQITVYTKADLKAAYELWQAGIFAPNGGNGMKAKITFGADIDFGGENFYGFGHDFDIEGGNHTLSNINFIAPEGSFGKAGLLYKGGNNVINNLTIKNATSKGAQAGIFGGNVDNVQLNNCALEGDITVNWVANADEAYNGVGAVWGVISTLAGTQIIDCDTSNANITINKGGITYPAGFTPEGNELVGVVYGGTYSIVVDGVAHRAITVANTADFQNALDNAMDGDYIFLLSGVTYDVVEISGPMAKNVTVFGSDGAVVKGMACDLPSFTPDNRLYGFTLKNVDFEGKGFYLTEVKNTSPWGFIENFTMDGCTFKGDDKEANVLGNRLFDVGADSTGSHQFINLKITNCKVDTAIQGIRVGSLRGECEISGNVITNVEHNAITIRSVQEGTVLVKGNNISNGGDRALRVGANSATINFVDNVIVNCGDSVDGSNFKANDLGTVTFSGNTVDGEAWNPLA